MKWIDIKKRKPVVNQEVIVCDHLNRVVLGCYFRYHVHLDAYGFEDQKNHTVANVQYWMEKPSPPFNWVVLGNDNITAWSPNCSAKGCTEKAEWRAQEGKYVCSKKCWKLLEKKNNIKVAKETPIMVTGSHEVVATITNTSEEGVLISIGEHQAGIKIRPIVSKRKMKDKI